MKKVFSYKKHKYKYIEEESFICRGRRDATITWREEKNKEEVEQKEEGARIVPYN